MAALFASLMAWSNNIRPSDALSRLPPVKGNPSLMAR
jgi:hypothetical protein